jgi:hypothetical protein
VVKGDDLVPEWRGRFFSFSLKSSDLTSVDAAKTDIAANVLKNIDSLDQDGQNVSPVARGKVYYVAPTIDGADSPDKSVT